MDFESIDAAEVHPSDLVGSAIQRREDPHLIDGTAEYTDDIGAEDEAHLALLGSRHAHAGIIDVDVSDARSASGVLGVYTQVDLEATGIDGTLRTGVPEDGVAPTHPLLADGHVTYAGQPIAAVVAADRYAAHDALDAIDVSYDRRDAEVDPRTAITGEATGIHDEAPDNVAFQWERGDADGAADAVESAETTVTLDIEINRVLPTAMEPRAALARYDDAEGELYVECSTQNPHTVRDDIASSLSMDPADVRVRPPDVGGGFGAKLPPYTGQVVAGWAAMEHDRPVKWVATRREDCRSMIHSRHHLVSAEAGVDADGTIRGVRAASVVPVGGYLVPGGHIVPTNLGLMANGQYAIPEVHVSITGAFTNTAPMAAYRGAGRPEATYFIERLVQRIAAELELDPADVRRRNFVQPEQFPYETGLGRTYDSGDYDETLDRALEAIDYDDFRERQREAREEGRYLGVGLSCYVEACGSAPGWDEVGEVEVGPDGGVTVRSGTAEIGTGHRTAYAQITANELGVDYDDVEVIEGDTAVVEDGHGTAGSRAMAVGGSAVRESAIEVREQAREVAGHLLEAAPEDVELGAGEFHVAGVPDRSVTIQEVARAVHEGEGSADVDVDLAAENRYDPPNYTFPFGTHAAIVEVEPETGEIDIERYQAVDDVGRQINPKIVEGQIHGGIVQGLGQALYEDVVYDDNGQLVSGSLQDYALPRAEHVPELETESTVTPCPHNPLGVKGVGEAGAIAAPPAIVNAVLDAVAPLGVDELDMPLTPERVWSAIDEAE